MGEQHAELLGLQSELTNAALKRAIENAPGEVRDAVDAQPGTSGARKAVRVNPLAWMAVAFLAGTVAGALLRPVVVRAGREAK